MKDFSVIICTHNRCGSLRRTLPSLAALRIPTALEWELLIVDNNSTDETPAVCQEFTRHLPLRYVCEPRQGKSCALNRAIAEVHAQLLLFTDDDVDVDQHWASALLDAARRHPEAVVFGGRTTPRWEGQPPRWLADNSLVISALNGPTMHFDWGHAERELRAGEAVFPGANMALRSSVFADGNLFCEALGPLGRMPTRGEDTEMIERLMTQGHHCVYVPAAIVYHRNPPERMTERFIREWWRGYGMAEVRLGAAQPTCHMWLGAPRSAWKQLVFGAARYALTRWTRPARVWLDAEIQMAVAQGMITEFRQQQAAVMRPIR